MRARLESVVDTLNGHLGTFGKVVAVAANVHHCAAAAVLLATGLADEADDGRWRERPLARGALADGDADASVGRELLGIGERLRVGRTQQMKGGGDGGGNNSNDNDKAAPWRWRQ